MTPTEIERIARAQLRLMKYGAFIGIIGGIASFVGEPHSGLIKAMIGCVVGCILLGRRLPRAMKEALDANDVMLKEIKERFK